MASRNPQGQTDRVDEVICPVDFSFDDESTMIRDKDFDVALISGCTATEESNDADINGRFNGALTYYLLTVLKGANGLRLPLTQVVRTVSGDLQRAGYTQQHPELLGSTTIGKKAFLTV